CHQETYYSF
nr:immunoglobulin light chain junction region [Macaca mulatta]